MNESLPNIPLSGASGELRGQLYRIFIVVGRNFYRFVKTFGRVRELRLFLRVIYGAHEVYALHNNKPLHRRPCDNCHGVVSVTNPLWEEKFACTRARVIKRGPRAIIRISAAFFFLNPDLPVGAINSPCKPNKHHVALRCIYVHSFLFACMRMPCFPARRGCIQFQFSPLTEYLRCLPFFFIFFLFFYFVKYVDMQSFHRARANTRWEC